MPHAAERLAALVARTRKSDLTAVLGTGRATAHPKPCAHLRSRWLAGIRTAFQPARDDGALGQVDIIPAQVAGLGDPQAVSRAIDQVGRSTNHDPHADYASMPRAASPSQPRSGAPRRRTRRCSAGRSIDWSHYARFRLVDCTTFADITGLRKANWSHYNIVRRKR